METLRLSNLVTSQSKRVVKLGFKRRYLSGGYMTQLRNQPLACHDLHTLFAYDIFTICVKLTIPEEEFFTEE